MKYIQKFLILLAVAALLLGFNPALAAKFDVPKDLPQKDFSKWEPPEREGTFDVPGRSDLKVRVLIYKAKPDKTTLPQLVCNLPDPLSEAIVDGAGWKLAGGQLTYRLNQNSVPASVGAKNLPIMSGDAFGRWSSAISPTSSPVTFVQGSNTFVAKANLDGQNIVTWGRAPANALAVTYIWYNRYTRILKEVDTIMNNKFAWSWSDPATWESPQGACADQKSYDAQDILTHELGHWVGLNDEYTADYQNNTMYGYGAKGEIKKDTLTTGDIAGVKLLY